MTDNDALGYGTYGKVFPCKHIDHTGEIKDMAVKKRYVSVAVEGICFPSEIVTASSCRAPFINNSLNNYPEGIREDVVIDEDMNPNGTESSDKMREDYCSCLTEKALGDLTHFTAPGSSKRDEKFFTTPYIKKFTFQILCGLAYMNMYGYSHNDVKLANILVFPDPTDDEVPYRIELCDFDAVTPINSKFYRNMQSGTLNYSSPEKLINSHYINNVDFRIPGDYFNTLYITETSDIFSVAICMLELLNHTNLISWSDSNIHKDFIRNPLYYIKNYNQTICDMEPLISLYNLDLTDVPSFFINRNEDEGMFLHLIRSMLECDPRKRPNAWECLNFDCFSDLVPYLPTYLSQTWKEYNKDAIFLPQKLEYWYQNDKMCPMMMRYSYPLLHNNLSDKMREFVLKLYYEEKENPDFHKTDYFGYLNDAYFMVIDILGRLTSNQTEEIRVVSQTSDDSQHKVNFDNPGKEEIILIVNLCKKFFSKDCLTIRYLYTDDDKETKRVTDINPKEYIILRKLRFDMYRVTSPFELIKNKTNEILNELLYNKFPDMIPSSDYIISKA